MTTKPKPRKAAAKPKTVNHGLTAKTAAKPKAKSRVVGVNQRLTQQHGAGFLGKIFPVLGAMGL